MATPLPDEGARELIRGRDDGLDETLFVEAGAGSGKTAALVDRVVALVAAGVALRDIATVTFTDKAAAELSERIRAALDHRRRAAAAAGDPAETQRWATALADVDAAAIGTLHSFARRILIDHPIEAGLPPRIEVLSEVASEVAFERRWRRFRSELLADAELGRVVVMTLAAGARLEHLRQLALLLSDDWDLAAARIPERGEPVPPPDVAALVAAITAVLDHRDRCADDSDRLAARLEAFATYLDELAHAADEHELLQLLMAMPSPSVGRVGRAAGWPGFDLGDLRERVRELGALRDEARRRVLDACLDRVAVELRRFTLAAAAERKRAGRLEFHDLLVLARDLLRGPHGPAVRSDLAARYRRILLDEVQDTDPIQIELAVLIASDDPADSGRDWTEASPQPGRLFLVGDPKQSIYRFRRADIATFLTARRILGGGPNDPSDGDGQIDGSGTGNRLVRLSTNFRSTPALVGWVNHVFARLVTFAAGSQPSYHALVPAPGAVDVAGPAVTLLGAAENAERDVSADELRAREAADVARAVTAAIRDGWQVRDRDSRGSLRPARPGDITILLPARTSLAALERALEDAGIAYRVEAASLVYATRQIRDVMLTLAAVADPSDRLALVAALRSPLFGCGDDDLATYRLRHGGVLDLLARPPDGVPDEHPVVGALASLRAWHDDGRWLTPSELLDRIVTERRVLELGFADHRPRDLLRRIRFVVDQARAWSEAEGGTLREYLDWARLQASESARVAETVLPETDDESVRIMTVHAAKGLEFPVTILSGMSTRPQRQRGVELRWPPDGGYALRLSAQVSTRAFEAFAPLDERMSHHERLRLLYVACTRARDHLVVSLHRTRRRGKRTSNRAGKEATHGPGAEDDPAMTSAELLARASVDAPSQTSLPPVWLVPDREPAVVRVAAAGEAHAAGEAAAAPFADDITAWQGTARAALDYAGRPPAIAATRLRHLAADDHAGADGPAPVTADDVGGLDPGLRKDPRDLDLAPWLKGRYGTGVGRAVHGVLQTVDLATGAGLDAAVAAQAAAEGVPHRADDVAALARAALAADVVRRAATRPHWRETYVGTRLGEQVLEGYVDLLFRDDDGLVVVDYKTAGPGDDLDQRVARYRLQAAAYAVAVAAATGERVSRCVLAFLTPDGPVERELTDIDAATAEVRRTIELATT